MEAEINVFVGAYVIEVHREPFESTRNSKTFLEVPSVGAFAKLRKSDCQPRHVCPSVRMEQLGSHWTDFHEILYLSIFFCSKNYRENSSLVKFYLEQEMFRTDLNRN